MDTPNNLTSARTAPCEPEEGGDHAQGRHLCHFPNPLDKRQKLVSRAEVLALLLKRAEPA